MPVTVKGPDGNTYQFPDGTDKSAAVAYFKKKGIGVKQSAPAPSRLERFESAVAPSDAPTGAESPGVFAMRQVKEFGKGAASGVEQIVAHPIDTIKSMGDQTVAGGWSPNGYPIFAPTGNVERDKANQEAQAAAQKRVAESAQQGLEHPAYTIGSVVGPAVAEEGVRAGVGVVRGKLPSPRARAAEELVKKTTEENVLGAEEQKKVEAAHADKALDAAHTNRGNEIEHAVKQKAENLEAKKKNLQAQREHMAESAKVKEGNTAAVQEQEKIPATRDKLDKASKEFQAQIETARAKALKVGNEKYSAVNEKLGGFPADTGDLTDALQDSLSRISGTGTEPPILKSVADRLLNEGGVSYGDLQGYYSELGRELSKGTLPGDIYNAYDTLHEAIGSEMQRIADAQGEGAALHDARNYWRRMKQAFGKPYNPNDAGNLVLEKTSPEYARKAEQENRLRLLGSFDKGIPSTAEHIANLRKGLDALPKEQPLRKVVKGLPERPEAVAPKSVEKPNKVEPPDRPKDFAPKKIGAEDIRLVKQEALVKTRQKIVSRINRVAAYGGGFAAIFELMRGQVGLGLESAAAAGAVYTGGQVIDALLQNPKVVESLTRPTAKDIAAIPMDMRDNLANVAREAQKRGIKVSPALMLAVTGAASKGPSPRHPSDEYSDPNNR